MVQPSCSASSSPIVFLPSRRYGSLSVERSNQPTWGATSATILPAVAIEPSTVKTCAPAISASATAAGGVPRGTITAHGRAPPPADHPPPPPAVFPGPGRPPLGPGLPPGIRRTHVC